MSAAGRRWLEVRVRCPSAGDHAALLADGLVSIGGRAVEERDGWFVTHVDEPEDPPGFRDQSLESLARLTGLGGIEIEVAWRAHEEWAETWKRGLAARRITDRIVVRPSWIEPEDRRDDDIEIVLDPGMAFGTAEHGTTRGCLRLLGEAVRHGDRVLDVGAGSGILTIAAIGLGAAEVVAIDGDQFACEALVDNVDRNGVSDRVRLVRMWADVDSLLEQHPANGVVANIESGILSPLVPGLVGALLPGGWLIVSGVLDAEWATTETRIVGAGCRLVASDVDGAWRSGLFRRHA